LARHGFYDSLSDKEYIIRDTKASTGQTLNIENPTTFNDKLAWLKLYDRRPLYTKLVDKYEVREFVSEKIGLNALTPLVGGPWESPAQIDFDSLPSQFVLKCTHDSGGVIVCKDKFTFDFKQAKKELSRHLKRNFFYMNREFPYKKVPPRIIAEAYMHEDSKPATPVKDKKVESVSVDALQSQYGLLDYKITCFNGKARLFMIFVGVIGNQSKADDYYENVYDENFTLLDLADCNPHAAPQYPKSIQKPSFFDDMIEKAELLAKDIPLVRIDFYHTNGQIKFGEITLYPDGGTTVYKPDHWETILGGWLQLPEVKQ